MQEKINKLASLFEEVSKRMTYGQKRASKMIIEDLVNDIVFLQQENANLRAKMSNKSKYEYDNDFEKMISVIQCLDFDLVDIVQIKKQELDFFYLNKEAIKKGGSITPKRFLNFIELIRYFFRTENRYPLTLNELTDKYNELKQLREQD